MDVNDLARRFSYHPPKGPEQASLYMMIRSQGYDLARFIDIECPDSREKSLAITHLEEAIMWAIASIARNT